MAFWEERRLPCGVLGPRERAPLTREERMRLSEDISAHYQYSMSNTAGSMEVLSFQAHSICERDWDQRRLELASGGGVIG